MSQQNQPDTGSSQDTHLSGSDGTADSPMCQIVYRAPGCAGQAPGECDSGHGGACGGVVCDCQGRIHQTNCDRSDVPFAYWLDPNVVFHDAGPTCDPNHPDAGKDH
jgi:hypothetical protein